MFSWQMTFGVFLFVFLEAFFSWRSGTLTATAQRRPNLPFLRHGAMWADALFLSVVLGLVLPHLVFSWPVFVFGIALGALITALLHQTWGSGDATGHMWPAHAHRSWIRDLSVAGWMHLLFTAGVIATLFLYCVSPVSDVTIWFVAIVLTFFVPLAALQPSWAITGRMPDKNAWHIAIFLWVLVWLLSMLKLAGVL